MSIDEKGKKKTIFGSLSILGVVALKFKVYILAAWKAMAVLKLSWLLSPLLSIGVYAMLWGWPYALAIVLLLFIHEMGHWIWMKCLGLNPKAPVFIPGLGAYVAMTNLPPDQVTHAWVAIAGPLVGGVGCAALYTMGVHTGNHWLMAAGSTGFMLNLLQLVPAKPLDGGFIIQAVSRWLLIPGTVLLLALAFCFKSVLLLIIGGISGLSLVRQFMAQPQKPIASHASSEMAPNEPPKATSSSDLAPASVPQRIVIAVAYLSLAGMLAYLYWLSTSELVSLIPQKH